MFKIRKIVSKTLFYFDDKRIIIYEKRFKLIYKEPIHKKICYSLLNAYILILFFSPFLVYQYYKKKNIRFIKQYILRSNLIHNLVYASVLALMTSINVKSVHYSELDNLLLIRKGFLFNRYNLVDPRKLIILKGDLAIADYKLFNFAGEVGKNVKKTLKIINYNSESNFVKINKSLLVSFSIIFSFNQFVYLYRNNKKVNNIKQKSLPNN